MIRNSYGYKTYNHAVFAGFLPGFISVHGCFCFLTLEVQYIFHHFHFTFVMDHNYCVADSSADILGSIWVLDMTDAVPFSITEMELSLHAGRLNFEHSLFAIAFSWQHLCSLIVCSKDGSYRLARFGTGVSRLVR